jgi:tetratricopeptide (TPR) repeat protein
MKNSLINCKRLTGLLFIFLGSHSPAQNNSDSSFDPLSFGVVLDDPAMKNVSVKKDVIYLKDEKGSLAFDVYLPPQATANELRPAIIFLNAIGEIPGQRKVKTWGIYSSWPKLVAAKGYIGISMETDGSRIQESIQGLFNFLDKHGNNYGIDKNKLGIYAASANVTQSVNYLMNEKVYKGIRAAVLYYGGAPGGPFRKDLPVMFVISEGDVARNGYSNLWNEVLKNNAPWTIKMGTGMPHAFDAYSDNDEARKIVKETIAFWKDQLDPVPVPAFAHSKMRDVFGLLRINTPKALELLKSIAEEHPDDLRILLFYGDVLRESGKPDEAETLYKKILIIEPGNTRALVAMAALLYIKDKNVEAEKYVSDAVSSGKMTSNTYGDLGFTLLVAGKDKEAAKFYQKAVEMQPNAHDFYNLACAYAKYGEKELAFAALNRSFEYGYGSKQLIENDTDLTSLRSDSRFAELLTKVK